MTLTTLRPRRPAGPDGAGHVPGGAAGTRARVAGSVQRHGAVSVLVLLVGAFSLTMPDFGSVANLQNIVVGQCFLALVALGMTFVVISGGIDLSVGSVFALGGVVAAWAAPSGVLPALLAPVALCGLVGLVNGLLVGRAGMAPFIVTLASLLGARGLLLALSDEGSTTYQVPRGETFHTLGTAELLGLTLPVWVVLGLFGCLGVVLHRTGFGHAVQAVGSSEDAATLMGLRVPRVKVAVYTLSGTLAGLAGALNAAWLASGVTILGNGMELEAIAAVVIGGTLLTGGAGSVLGTLAGVLLLGVIQNGISQAGTLDSSMQAVVSGAFLVVVVVLQTVLSRTQRLR